MGCRFLLQGISPTQGSNLRLLHGQAGSSPLRHQGDAYSVYIQTVKPSLIAINQTEENYP